MSDDKRFEIPKGASAFKLSWDENEDKVVVNFETSKEPDNPSSNEPAKKKGGLKNWLTGADE